MTNPVRIACLGAGYFASFHYDSWKRMSGAVPVAACDATLSRAQSTGLPAFDRLDIMLDSTRPDLLDVILPPAAQAGAIRTALAHGLRWIICQKPFCTSLDEARAITAEAEAAGATLIIHENFRFQPWYRMIRKAMDDGMIGDPMQASFRLRPGDGQGADAYLDRQPYFRDMPRFLLHETGVHWVDTFRYLMGPAVSVFADLRRLNPAIAGEDAGFLLFDHGGGRRSLLDANRHLDHASDNTRRTMGEGLIEGTTGTLTLVGDGSVHLRRFGKIASTELLPPDRFDGFGGDCVHALNRHVIDAMCCAGDVENPARDYLTVLKTEAAAYASADTGQRVSLRP